VSVYRAWTRAAPAAASGFVDASREVVDLFAADPVAALRSAYARLRVMAEAADLDYDSPALSRIAALAQDHGGAAKPSGAGGGDVAVAIIPDDDARAAFALACAAEGLAPIPVSIVSGVRVEVSE